MAGTTGSRPGGDELPDATRAVFTAAIGRPRPVVGSLRAGASPLGVLDLAARALEADSVDGVELAWVVAAALAVSACNTVSGVGRDVSAAGSAVTSGAEQAKN